MSSVREVTRRYNKLLKQVKEDDYYKVDLTNRVNIYTCTVCHHPTKTKDIDPGVTPFIHTCEKCGSIAHSSFYKDLKPSISPTQVWYRPSLDETLKLRKNSNLLEHVLSGGLLNRKEDSNG